MKKRISVLAARQPDQNTGMITVDLAAHSVLLKNFPGVDVRFYTLGRNPGLKYMARDIPIVYTPIESGSSPFFDADLWVYWGDFIHSAGYLAYDLRKSGLNHHDDRRESAVSSVADFETLYFDVVFQNSCNPAKLRRSFVFGSTLISNSAAAVKDIRYRNHLERFFQDVGGVLLRDPFSAAAVQHLRSSECILGCDPAMLLRDCDLDQLGGFRSAFGREGVGVFVGRNSGSRIRTYLFALVVAKRLRCKIKWIPWFEKPRKTAILARSFGIRIPTGERRAGEPLAALAECRYVITDTYHLCVNSWRMGVPCVCVGRGCGGMENSLGEKKKEVFFRQYGAQEFYVYSEEIATGSGLWRCAVRASALLIDGEQTNTITDGILKNARRSENVFIEWVRKML